MKHFPTCDWSVHGLFALLQLPPPCLPSQRETKEEEEEEAQGKTEEDQTPPQSHPVIIAMDH